MRTYEPEKLEKMCEERDDIIPSEMLEKSAQMIGFSNNLSISLDQSSIRKPTDNETGMYLDSLPDWALTINRKSTVQRRSTNKSIKRVSAARHEELIR